MSELRRNLGIGGVALLPLVCCIGLPLLVAAGLSVAALVWIGGIGVDAVALVAAFVLLYVRARTRRSSAVPVPPTRRSSP